MNPKKKYYLKYSVFIALFLSALFFNSCTESKEQSSSDNEYYTCPMHPTVKSETPGACPVCNMTLIKVKEKQGSVAGLENALELSKRQQELMNIATDTARIKNISELITLTGEIAVDETKVNVITSKIKGRVEELFVRNPGELIQKGQALYSIYSEELSAAENEFLLMLRQQSQAALSKETIKDFIEASRKKLLLWGMNEKQVKELEISQQASALLTVYSNSEGYLAELKVNEGEYVETGTPLFKISNLKTLWVNAQVYSDEIRYVNQQPIVNVETEAYPNKFYKGELVFDNPALEEDSKISTVRFRINNADAKLKPGMMAYIALKKNEKKTLVVPKSALLLGKMKTVWIKNGTQKFESRMVETGMENKKEVEILSGVKEGEVVVSSGAYLINSEYILKRGATKTHVH